MMDKNEWQYDANGKRFRKDGYIIEYAPEIKTASGGTMYMDELEDYHRRMKEQNKKRKQEEQTPKGSCPFKEARNNIRTLCDSDCAFFENTACILSGTKAKPEKDTKGKPCPIGCVCHDNCTMYDGGCKLTCFIKGMKPGKE